MKNKPDGLFFNRQFCAEAQNCCDRRVASAYRFGMEEKMRYRVGMYGGSFDPLHIGHLHDIIRAAAMCEELYVMISWCEGRESTSKELRYRWIHNNIRHLPNVKIIMIEDKAVSKEVYNTDYYWEKAPRILGRRSESRLTRCSAARTIWEPAGLKVFTARKAK